MRSAPEQPAAERQRSLKPEGLIDGVEIHSYRSGRDCRRRRHPGAGGPRYLGLWLTGLFGDPDTTDNGDGSIDHEFVSGGEGLPSYTLEVGMPNVPAFFVHAGVKLNSIALEFTRSGRGDCDHQCHRPG